MEYKFINTDRVRFFEKGKIYTVLNDEKSTIEDCIFENDYGKLRPTITELTEDEIQQLKFELNLNGEKMNICFNKILAPPVIREINERWNKKEIRFTKKIR
ncbi:hypothetical protein CLU81_0481 [Flavobacterium sp. 9]|uniref:hypothetical protein n=1 Tax=Flavobacterium sp. 9 TaxID=2035198 RepID=UPI000C1A03A3|nr:hypothetical protein [Flavobacterium sp. 9]PIF30085.1 hypothetical protein CLU81_0481 [Flavobacterium sp. 9]